jgi:hypothetical protein
MPGQLNVSPMTLPVSEKFSPRLHHRSLKRWVKELNTLQKTCDFLGAVINWVDQQFRGVEGMTDDRDGYLHLVMKEFASTHEPPSELWAEIKAKAQREAALNQIKS